MYLNKGCTMLDFNIGIGPISNVPIFSNSFWPVADGDSDISTYNAFTHLTAENTISLLEEN